MAAYQSSSRRSTPVQRSISTFSITNLARCELDSHADTCALGCNFLPLSYTGRVCDVSPYNSSAYQPERNIPIVSAATAFTCQDTGQTFILVINEALWFGDRLAHSLINLNQVRFRGITVNDNPFDPRNPISIKTDNVDIPLHLLGTTIFLNQQHPHPTNSSLVLIYTSLATPNGIHTPFGWLPHDLWRRKWSRESGETTAIAF